MRTREGLAPFFTRSGDRRNSVMLASVLLDMFADDALSTTLCKYDLTLRIAGISSSIAPWVYNFDKIGSFRES